MALRLKNGLILLALAGAFYLLSALNIRSSQAQVPQVTMIWTAPQGTTTGARYEMRYSRTAVGVDTLTWWNNAVMVAGLPTPGAPGVIDSVSISPQLFNQTYYVIIRACNGTLCAGYSNVATFTTPAAPPFRITDLRLR